MAANSNSKNNTRAAKISEILKIFTLDKILSFLLNFNENKGISTTNSIGIITASTVSNCISVNIGNLLKSI